MWVCQSWILVKLICMIFFYNHLKPKYGENMKLNFTDTDSFCLEIQTPDVYADMKENSDFFDTSNFPTNHFFCIVIKIKRSLESLKMNVQITPHLNLWVSSQRCTVLIWGLQRKRWPKGSIGL